MTNNIEILRYQEFWKSENPKTGAASNAPYSPEFFQTICINKVVLETCTLRSSLYILPKNHTPLALRQLVLYYITFH